jgi:hypothetical protein
VQRVLMRVSPEFPTVTQARFLFVRVLFLVLMGFAHGGAESPAPARISIGMCACLWVTA